MVTMRELEDKIREASKLQWEAFPSYWKKKKIAAVKYTSNRASEQKGKKYNFDGKNSTPKEKNVSSHADPVRNQEYHHNSADHERI